MRTSQLNRRQLLIRHAETCFLPEFLKDELLAQLHSAPEQLLQECFLKAISSHYLYLVHFRSSANSPEHEKSGLLDLARIISSSAAGEQRELAILFAKLCLLDQCQQKNLANAIRLFTSVPGDLWPLAVISARKQVLDEFPHSLAYFDDFIKELQISVD